MAGRGTDPPDLLGEQQRRLVEISKVRALRRLSADGLHDFRASVTNESRAPSHGKVEIFTTCHVPKSCTLSPCNNDQLVRGKTKFTVRNPSREGLENSGTDIVFHEPPISTGAAVPAKTNSLYYSLYRFLDRAPSSAREGVAPPSPPRRLRGRSPKGVPCRRNREDGRYGLRGPASVASPAAPADRP